MWKIVLCILGILVLGFGIYTKGSWISVQEYEVGQRNIKGDVDIAYFEAISEDFTIGANIRGYAVFKNPARAYETMTELYDEGILLIQEEFGLPDMTKRNFLKYSTYGWQVTTGTEEAQKQAAFVSEFFDIYENSFGYGY